MDDTNAQALSDSALAYLVYTGREDGSKDSLAARAKWDDANTKTLRSAAGVDGKLIDEEREDKLGDRLALRPPQVKRLAELVALQELLELYVSVAPAAEATKRARAARFVRALALVVLLHHRSLTVSEFFDHVVSHEDGIPVPREVLDATDAGLEEAIKRVLGSNSDVPPKPGDGRGESLRRAALWYHDGDTGGRVVQLRRDPVLQAWFAELPWPLNEAQRLDGIDNYYAALLPDAYRLIRPAVAQR